MAPAEPNAIIEQFPEGDRPWAQDFSLAMWLNDLNDSQSVQELENALAAIRDSGQGAEDLFGDPSEYGEVRSYARLTPQQLADSEMSINSSMLLLAGLALWLAYCAPVLALGSDFATDGLRIRGAIGSLPP